MGKPHKKRWWERVPGWWATRVTTLALSFVLMVAVSMLPSRDSMLGAFGSSSKLYRPRLHEAWVVDSPSGPKVVDTMPQRDDRWFARLSCPLHQQDLCIAFSTSRAINHTVMTHETSRAPRTLTPEEWINVRAQYADYVAQRSGMPEVAALIRSGDGVQRTVLWTGYIKNLGLLALVSGFGLSLAWIPGRSRAALLDRGLCPSCRYELRGLPAARCPECGHKFSN